MPYRGSDNVLCLPTPPVQCVQFIFEQGSWKNERERERVRARKRERGSQREKEREIASEQEGDRTFEPAKRGRKWRDCERARTAFFLTVSVMPPNQLL
jgi:hypothetical protein